MLGREIVDDADKVADMQQYAPGKLLCGKNIIIELLKASFSPHHPDQCGLQEANY